MQNETNHPRRNRQGKQTKGYYIALVLCLAAVGISGYVFVRSIIRSTRSAQTQSQTLSTSLVPEEGLIEEAEASVSLQTPAQASSGQTEAKTAAKTDTKTAEAASAAPETAQEAVAAVNIQDLLPETETVYDPAQDPELCWPVSGLVTDQFSMEALVYSATMGDWRVHEGIDIQAAQGTAVQSVCQGTVTAVYEDALMGWTVVVDHGGGYETKYANLADSVPVAAGQTVAAGDQLGFVGSSAMGECAQEPHLHLEVWKDGALIDPVDFLP